MRRQFSLNTALSSLLLLCLTLVVIKKNSPILVSSVTSVSYADLNETLSEDLSFIEQTCRFPEEKTTVIAPTASSWLSNQTAARSTGFNRTVVKLIDRNDSFVGDDSDEPQPLYPKTHGYLKGYFLDTTHDYDGQPELLLVHLQYYFKTYHCYQDTSGLLAQINSYIDYNDLVEDDFDFFIGDLRFRDALYQIIAFRTADVKTSFTIQTITNTTQALLMESSSIHPQDIQDSANTTSYKCLILRYLVKDVELKQARKRLKPNPNLKVKKSPYTNNEQCAFILTLQSKTNAKQQEDPQGSAMKFDPDDSMSLWSLFSRSELSTSFPTSSVEKNTKFQGHLISPNCNTRFISSSSLTFTKRETLVKSELDSCFILIVLSLLQLYVTILQIRTAETTVIERARLSQTSILILASFDFCVGALCFIRCFFDDTADEAIFESLLTLAFVKLIEYAFYDMKLVFSVAKAQARERLSLLTKIKYYCCFVLGFYCGFVLVSEWFPWMIEVIVVFLYCFWVPQIIRNVYKNSRATICNYFLFGGTFFRLVTGTFLWICVFKSGGYPFYDRHTLNWLRVFTLVFLITLVSIALLLIQRYRGARSIVPSCLPLPVFYNYHQISSSFPYSIGLAVPECAICFNEIQLHHHRKQASTGPLVVTDLMQTPCGHLFDTKCLERWIESKLECPVCRSSIPEYS